MKLELFEPALCCTSGVCGPEPDRQLMDLQNLLSRVTAAGVQVERYAINQRASAFVQNETVKSHIKKTGVGCLPLVLIDDSVVLSGQYPDEKFLSSWIPNLPESKPAQRVLASF
jgi:hypothetical protein